MVTQLNRSAKGNVLTYVNKEGRTVLKENDEILLFLLMSSLKLQDSFYDTADERLRTFEKALDDVYDLKYKLALAVFMSDIVGIKLAPTIALAREALRFKGEQNAKLYIFKHAVDRVIDRPDKITNTLAYSELLTGSAKNLPPFYKKLLRERLESFNDYTLRKFRQANKKVKLSDAIKILHPKPINASMSRLYKNIIENSKEASIIKGTVVTEVLSDSELSNTQKNEWIAENVNSIPINALIRNLTNVPKDKVVLDKIALRIADVLEIKNGLPTIKIVNPFDILKAGINCNDIYLMSKLNDILGDYARSIDLGVSGSKVTFLVDVSGSMGGFGTEMRYMNTSTGSEIAAQYLSLLFPALYNVNKVSFYTFDTHVYEVPQNKYHLMNPLAIYSSLKNDLRPRGGTSLVTSAKYVVAKTNPDLLIVISDEVTWADNENTIKWKFENDAKPYIILINPYPTGGTVFSKTNKIVKVSSLDAKLLYYIPALYNFSEFKKNIIG